MALTLTCMFSLYDEATNEYTHQPLDPELGENVKQCLRVDAAGSRETNLFVRIPPIQRVYPKGVKHYLATMTTMTAHAAEIRKQETVFVKWALDRHRVNALRHELSFYMNELVHLQGKFVPRLIGYYESSNKNEHFALSIFEPCFGGLPFDSAEYHRQFMIAACAVHAAGVVHGQLALGYDPEAPTVDRHVFFNRSGRARIVDFTRARRHKCSGAPLRVPGAATIGGSCEELDHLEAVIGERLTGMTARDAERLRNADLAKMRREAEMRRVGYHAGPSQLNFRK